MKAMIFLCQQYAESTKYLYEKYGVLNCKAYGNKPAFQMSHEQFLTHFHKYAIKEFTGGGNYKYELFADLEGMQFFCIISEDDVKKFGLNLNGLLQEELPEVTPEVAKDGD